MHAAGEVLRSFQRAFHERRVDYHLVALTSVNSLFAKVPPALAWAQSFTAYGRRLPR